MPICIFLQFFVLFGLAQLIKEVRVATLQERIAKALETGPGHLKGQVRILADGSLFEVSIPFEDGFRQGGCYIRVAVENGTYLAAVYSAGKTTLPKSEFIGTEVEKLHEMTPISPTELERRIENLLFGRT